MSTVIREAVVRIRTEQQKAKLEAPDIGPAAKAYKEIEQAATESAKAQREAAKAEREVAGAAKESGEATKKSAETSSVVIRDYERVHTQSTEQILRNFREGGEGALRMARGIAFLSASGQEDMKKLLQTVMVAQGAFDVGAGGLKVFTSLARVAGPQAAAAITLVTAAVTAGTLAWQKWNREQEEAKRRAEETRQSLENLARAETSAASARGDRIANLRIGAALTERAKYGRIEDERRRTVTERGKIEDELLASDWGRDLRGQSPQERARSLRIGGAVNPRELDYQRELQERLQNNSQRQLDLERQLAERDMRFF